MVSSKSIEANLMQNMARMIHRNLKVCLALLPALSQLRCQLQYRNGISTVERDTWKASNGEKLRRELKNVLKQYKLPSYLLNFLEWLFLATEEEVVRLKAFIRNPRGEVPAAYNYLVKPAFQFNSPFRVGWLLDTGYRVAIMTLEKPGYWQIWGTQIWGSDTRSPLLDDTETFSPVLLKYMLRDSGDFVVRGSLDLFDAHLCRHTFAINYLLNGGDIFSLREILGHSTLEMVNHYLHFTSSQITAQHHKYSPMDRMQEKERGIESN